VASTGEERNAYKVLVEKPEGYNHLEDIRPRFECNNKMDLKEIAWDAVNWINLAHDRDVWRALVNTVVSLRIPWNARSFLSASGTILI
jgi:hypothetical protein